MLHTLSTLPGGEVQISSTFTAVSLTEYTEYAEKSCLWVTGIPRQPNSCHAPAPTVPRGCPDIILLVYQGIDIPLCDLCDLCDLERAKRVGERKAFKALSLTEYTEKDRLICALCPLRI